jgi:hypothetical protein
VVTTFYRDADVHITGDGVRVGERWYPLAELDRVWHVRRRRPLRYGSMLAATVGVFVALAVPVLVLAGLGVAWIAARPGAERAVAALVVLAALAVAVVLFGRAAVEMPLNLLDRLHVHGTDHFEIRARWRGAEVVVFETGDALRFGKVYRSLRRAVEHDLPPRS